MVPNIFQRLLGQMAHDSNAAQYACLASALASCSSPEMGMALQHTSRGHHSEVPLHIQPLVGPFISTECHWNKCPDVLQQMHPRQAGAPCAKGVQHQGTEEMWHWVSAFLLPRKPEDALICLHLYLTHYSHSSSVPSL